MIKGIDISSHNGEVNFEEIKNNGIEFCLIRLGWGDDEYSQDDIQFERNINECQRLQIPFGIYIYSYATNYGEAESEIKHTLRQIEKCKCLSMFKFGVWFDMEDADGYKERHGVLNNNDLLCDFCSDFCDEIEKEGYFAGIYANKYWLENKLNQDRLDRFAKWVAQWYENCTYNKTWAIWQNSNSLYIDDKRFDSDIVDEVYYNYFMKSEEIKEEPKENTAEEIVKEIKDILDNYYKE